MKGHIQTNKKFSSGRVIATITLFGGGIANKDAAQRTWAKLVRGIRHMYKHHTPKDSWLESNT